MKGRGYIPGRMEDDTKESLRTIRCMEMVFSNGRMARSTTESIYRIKKKDKENSNGMEIFI